MQEVRTREMLLAAMFPFIGLSLLNTFYRAPLYAAHPAWFWLADAVQFVLVPVACYWLLLRPARIGWADVGLRAGPDRFVPSKDRPAELVFAVTMFIGAYWPVDFAIWAWTWQYSEPSVVQQALPSSWSGKLLVACYLSAGAAVVEEVMYRALPWLYLRQVVSQRWRRTLYIYLTTIVFALAHSEQGIGGMMGCAWFGWLAARLYLRQGTLWPCVLGHFVVDMLVFGPW